jgi:hypothetical protein
MVQLVFPLFREPPAIDTHAMAKSLQRRHRANKFTPEAGKDSVSELRVDDILVMLMPIPTPIPGDDIANVHHFARRGWHKTSDTPENHRAHAIVTTVGDHDPKQQAAALTMVVGELCRSKNCLAAMWGASGVLAHRDVLIGLAEEVSANEPALMLWVDAMPYRNEQGVGLSTRGLSTFIGRELHFLPSPHHEIETVFDRAADFAEYLYAHGPVVLDGQSVGYSETDVIRARWTEDPGEKDGETRRWIELTVEKLDHQA